MIYGKYLTVLLALVSLILPSTAASETKSTAAFDNKATTIYLIRHTEKEQTGERDPALTEQGRYRAQNWATVFKDIQFDTVYSTDTIRTRDTAAPTAHQQSKAVELYSPKAVDYQAFIENNLNKTILVVGHSNTIPAFVNGLVGKDKYQDLEDSAYSKLFVVTIIGDNRTANMLTIETQKPGALIMPKHEKINYLEYAAKDLQATKQFFINTFNWQFQDYGPDYIAFSNQGVDGGFYRADMASSSSNGGALTVFYSDDLEQTLQKISAAGGVIIKPIFSFPGGRRFHFTEPSGNEFAVWGE